MSRYLNPFAAASNLTTYVLAQHQIAQSTMLPPRGGFHIAPVKDFPDDYSRILTPHSSAIQPLCPTAFPSKTKQSSCLAVRSLLIHSPDRINGIQVCFQQYSQISVQALVFHYTPQLSSLKLRRREGSQTRMGNCSEKAVPGRPSFAIPFHAGRSVPCKSQIYTGAKIVPD